jgi:alanine racemase
MNHRCWVEVSRGRIAANYRAVARLVGSSVEVMPVVKADAYRHGAAEVARVLEREGVSWMAVSSVEEGVALRQAGISTRILVMAGFLPWERDALLEYGLTPAVHSLEDLQSLNALAAARGTPTPYHLKIDSGMGRLGTRAALDQVVAAVRAAPFASLEGLMTHFASAARQTSDQTQRQLSNYNAALSALRGAGLSPAYSHLSATIPVAYGIRSAWGNMVRPGQAIYGYVSPVLDAAEQSLLEVRPALSWKAAVLSVKEVPEGAEIGYGAMFRAPQAMRIAVLSVGYADGLPHRLSNRGRVIAGGRFARILGAVSMDLTTVDASDVPSLRPGDSVTLLGESGDLSIDAQQVARAAGTISYSVLCGISARVKRVYLD